MLHIKSKTITSLCMVSVLLFPVLAQAEPTSTGSIAASQAADQKAALAKKAAKRQAKKAAQELKAAQEQKVAQEQQAAEAQKPVEPQQDESTVKPAGSPAE